MSARTNGKQRAGAVAMTTALVAFAVGCGVLSTTFGQAPGTGASAYNDSSRWVISVYLGFAVCVLGLASARLNGRKWPGVAGTTGGAALVFSMPVAMLFGSLLFG